MIVFASAGDNITPLFIGQLRPPRSWFSLRERALVQAQALQDAADRAPDRLRVIRSRADLADHLARRQAGAQVLGVAQPGIGPQRAQQRVLQHVLGVFLVGNAPANKRQQLAALLAHG